MPAHPVKTICLYSSSCSWQDRLQYQKFCRIFSVFFCLYFAPIVPNFFILQMVCSIMTRMLEWFLLYSFSSSVMGIFLFFFTEDCTVHRKNLFGSPDILNRLNFLLTVESWVVHPCKQNSHAVFLSCGLTCTVPLLFCWPSSVPLPYVFSFYRISTLSFCLWL